VLPLIIGALNSHPADRVIVGDEFFLPHAEKARNRETHLIEERRLFKIRLIERGHLSELCAFQIKCPLHFEAYEACLFQKPCACKGRVVSKSGAAECRVGAEGGVVRNRQDASGHRVRADRRALGFVERSENVVLLDHMIRAAVARWF